MVWLPREIAANRAAKLDRVPYYKLLRKKGRDLAIAEALDGELDPGVIPCRRCNRVTPLGLIPILRGQPNVDVLAGEMPGPCAHVEGDGADSRRILVEHGHRRWLPIA